MKKLPGDTHIKNMHPDLKKYVIQNLSMYKGNGKTILLQVLVFNSISNVHLVSFKLTFQWNWTNIESIKYFLRCELWNICIALFQF